jgi:hypothetical protein
MTNTARISSPNCRIATVMWMGNLSMRCWRFV